LTVNVDVTCPPFVTCPCAGFNEHTGANAGAGDTLQLNATAPANPPVDPTVTVAFADWPGVTGFGVVDDGAEMLKSGAAGFTLSEGYTVNCSLVSLKGCGGPNVPVIPSG